MERSRNIEKQRQNETFDIRKAAEKVGKVALAAFALSTAVNTVSKLNKEVMATERGKEAEVVRVDAVSIHGGPNVRSNPEIPDNPEESNILMKFDSNRQIEIPYEGEVYIYNGRDDANGEWYGFVADEFAITSREAGCIGEGEKDRITGHEGKNDGIVWINSDYADLSVVETEN